LTPDEQLPKALKLLTSRGLEVMLFQVLDPDEIELPFEGDIIFESLEDDPEVNLDPRDVQAEYQVEMQALIKNNREVCKNLGVDYELLDTSTSPGQALSYFLLKRKNGAQRWA